VEETEVPGE